MEDVSIFTLFLLCTSLLLYDTVIYTSDEDDLSFHPSPLYSDLKSKIHHQTAAVKTVIESLDEVGRQEPALRVLGLVGSSGVGKTYTANIVKRHFQGPLYEVNGPLAGNRRAKDVVTRILNDNSDSTFRFTLIIVDDLTVDDVDHLLAFLQALPQDLPTLVVCIFNIQETDDNLNHVIRKGHVVEIGSKLGGAGVSFRLAVFQEFQTDQVEDWLEKRLNEREVEPELRSGIVKSVLDDLDVRYTGLKGLDAKIRIEL